MDESKKLVNVVQLKEVEDMLRMDGEIIAQMGFKNDPTRQTAEGRQVIFDNQQIKDNCTLALTVVVLANSSRTFNFEYSHFPGKPTEIALQDRALKSLFIQIVEGNDYKQLSVQVYFEQPVNYQSEDLIFRVKVEKTVTGPKLNVGFDWLKPETHMPASAALDLTRQVCSLFEAGVVKLA